MAHSFRVFHIVAKLHSYSFSFGLPYECLVIIPKRKGKVNSGTERDKTGCEGTRQRMPLVADHSRKSRICCMLSMGYQYL